jgi:hypothetical protein
MLRRRKLKLPQPMQPRRREELLEPLKLLDGLDLDSLYFVISSILIRRHVTVAMLLSRRVSTWELSITPVHTYTSCSENLLRPHPADSRHLHARSLKAIQTASWRHLIYSIRLQM